MDLVQNPAKMPHKTCPRHRVAGAEAGSSLKAPGVAAEGWIWWGSQAWEGTRVDVFRILLWARLGVSQLRD